jgi:hypothetical protein
MGNVYFELTEELNARGTIAVLAGGQAVVFHRIALMSKDGDWVIRETEEACSRVLDVLGKRGAHYRPGAPLDVRWLEFGWSSHFEFLDDKRRRVRCDFLSRPPRLEAEAIQGAFAKRKAPERIAALDVASLIRMKQTQRAKDYPVIAELARLLPPEDELELTTDPDRIIELTPRVTRRPQRAPVAVALRGEGRDEVVVALAREVSALQDADRRRLEKYENASAGFLAEFQRTKVSDLPLPAAHREAVALAERLLPQDPMAPPKRS